jgi:quinol monooxygenase YgiN
MDDNMTGRSATFVVVVNIEVRPENCTEFRASVLKQASNSLAKSAGCLRFDVCEGAEDKAKFLLYEFYESSAHFAGHLQTEHFRSFDLQTRGWIKSKEVATFVLISSDR